MKTSILGIDFLFFLSIHLKQLLIIVQKQKIILKLLFSIFTNSYAITAKKPLVVVIEICTKAS